MAVEQRTERLDHGQYEDREAPEGEGVREPRDRPLQQLPLPPDLADLTPQALSGPVEPTGSRLALADQPEEPVEPASGHRKSDNGDHSTDSESHSSSCYSYRRCSLPLLVGNLRVEPARRLCTYIGSHNRAISTFLLARVTRCRYVARTASEQHPTMAHLAIRSKISLFVAPPLRSHTGPTSRQPWETRTKYWVSLVERWGPVAGWVRPVTHVRAVATTLGARRRGRAPNGVTSRSWWTRWRV